MLNESMITKIHRLGETRRINCWGATRAVTSKVNELYWHDEAEMSMYLEVFTSKISKREKRKGDIVAFYGSRNQLLHTAIYHSNSWYWHKPGSLPAEFSSLKNIESEYQLYSRAKLKIKFFRPD